MYMQFSGWNYRSEPPRHGFAIFPSVFTKPDRGFIIMKTKRSPGLSREGTCSGGVFRMEGGRRMSLLVRNIVERNLLDGAKLAAGEKGADNPVHWVNFMEILDALDSLQKGELLVTTGYRLDDREQNRDFILHLKSRGVCAVAIQTGYYISKIPQYILEDADRYGFPVLELPADLTFSHIMHVLMDNIDQKRDERNDADLVNLRGRAKRLIEACPEQTGKKYLALLSASVSSNAFVRSGLVRVAAKLKTCLSSRSAWTGMEICGSRVLYCMCLRGPFTAQDAELDVIAQIQEISREDRVNVWVGIGEAVRPEDPDAAFDQALTANQSLRNLGTKKGVCRYGNLRVLEWFEYFHRKNNSLSFAYDTLKPLISYDYFHNSDYLQTLRVYLANECKISETAEKLFIHRHTLSNRLEKISTLCGSDFEEYMTRLHFSVALFIYDYFLS